MTRDTISFLLDPDRSDRRERSSLVLKVKIAGCCDGQDGEGEARRIDGLTFFGAGSNGRTIKFSQVTLGTNKSRKSRENGLRKLPTV